MIYSNTYTDRIQKQMSIWNITYVYVYTVYYHFLALYTQKTRINDIPMLNEHLLTQILGF